MKKKFIRIVDNKPCYQLEADIQRLYFKKYFPDIDLYNLNPNINKQFVDKDYFYYMVKPFTLLNNLQEIKKLDNLKNIYYLDLDILSNSNLERWICEIENNKYMIGNFYKINWEIAFPDLNLKDFPKKWRNEIKDLKKSGYRFSTMFFRMDLFEEYLYFLSDLKLNDLIDKYYNKYFEEFLWSIFLWPKYKQGKLYNMYLRKDGYQDYNTWYYHLSTEELFNVDLNKPKWNKKFKKKVRLLKNTLKYNFTSN